MGIFSQALENIVLNGDVVGSVMRSHAAVVDGGQIDPRAGVDGDVMAFCPAIFA